MEKNEDVERDKLGRIQTTGVGGENQGQSRARLDND